MRADTVVSGCEHQPYGIRMPHPALDSLAVFLKAAELRSFSKAAIALGLTQPSVSRPIADLEKELGGALFYRT
ncbi:LysR family transcriptional regulator, partial [Rhizobiaceae sp. 2RAB30]